LFDPGFVHERSVKGADLSGIGAGGGARLGRLRDDGTNLLLRPVGQPIGHAEARLVGWDGGASHPGAVDVIEEAVARVDGRVDPGVIEAPVAVGCYGVTG